MSILNSWFVKNTFKIQSKSKNIAESTISSIIEFKECCVQEKREWIQSRKKLLAQVKSQVLAIQGSDGQIDAYANNYKKEFKGPWLPSSHQNLVAELTQFPIVLGGDFHAFSQAQRTHLRILREWPKKKGLVLALECIEARHQKSLEEYLADRITEEEFLEKCEWWEHWGFSWHHYKPLLDFARAQGIPVYGVNRYYKKRNLDSLAKRDSFAAKIILQLTKKYPHTTIYTLFGDLHLASSHLPDKICELAENKTLKLARVFQNSERLYFGLAKKNQEGEVEVLKGTKSRYCIMSSPPWVKWQSYLMFLEGSYDDDLEEDYDSIDFTDHVAHLVDIIQKDIGFTVNLDDLAVYSSEDFEVWRKVAASLSLQDRGLFLRAIADERTFVLPEQAFYYLSRISINHCAHLAGFYIHKQLSKLPRHLWAMPQDFLPLVWHEAVAFFLSKFINHKRKAERLSVIENQLRHTDVKDKGREALALVLDQRTDEWIYVKSGHHKKKKIKVKRSASYMQAARVLGSIMGEKLYKAYTFGRIEKSTLISFIRQDLLAEDFEDFYYLMVKRLEAQLALKSKGARL